MPGETEKRPGTLTTPQRFFADSMLGKLALWMRAAGYDVAYEKAIEDPELVRRALEERRIILTRDTLLILRRRVRDRYLFIESDRWRDQLGQVVKAYGIETSMFLSRCLRCNVLLRNAPPVEVEGRVPPYVFATQESFSSCPGCRRVYWAGTHRDEMVKEIARVLRGIG
jgi:uncharacterized protein with PIN domain